MRYFLFGAFLDECNLNMMLDSPKVSRNVYLSNAPHLFAVLTSSQRNENPNKEKDVCINICDQSTDI